MATALGVSADVDGNGVTPLVHRQIIGSYFQNSGVMDGLVVSGRNDLKYGVSAGCAVVQRAESDGKMLAYWPGGQTENAVSAGDPSNPRIDVVWVRANNKPEYSTDQDNQVHVGVTQGVPSANPVIPTVPQGCQPIGFRRMPAGATSTVSATATGDIDYVVPYGSTLGVLARLAENKDGTVDTTSKNPFLQQAFYIPTDRWILLHAYLCVSTPNKGQTGGVAAVQFYVDGEKYTTRKVPYTDSWETFEPTANVQVSAGRHTFGIAMYNEQGPGYKAHFSHNDPDDRGNYYVGRVLVVKDDGVTQ